MWEVGNVRFVVWVWIVDLGMLPLLWVLVILGCIFSLCLLLLFLLLFFCVSCELFLCPIFLSLSC